ncbi:MAG: hypothetical protein FJ279_37155, partial [Planctomycetes bacterium]|nr:hypothetical protein [Planctomycetota bacterium]
MTLTLDCATMARSLIPCCLALWVLGATASHAADGPATGEHGKAGSCYAFLEAEELKAEQCEVRPHFPNWYFGAPSGGKMLRAMTQGAHAQAQFAAPADGPYVLWVRYLSWRPYRETISVAVSQGERQRADAALNAARIVPTEYKSDDFGFFVWERVAVELAAGPVTVALANPDKRGWHLDCLVLTNDADCVPDTRDFAPPLYLRFTVTAEEPRTFYVRTVWKQIPWRGFVGYIGSSGMSRGRPSKPEALLKPNEPSPWIKVNRWLHPLLDNTLHIEQHGPDRAEASDFRGIVEVAAGTEKQLLRRYEVKRDGCRFNLILPLDVGNPTRLKADYEFVEDTARYVKTLPAPQGQRPSQMLLATHLALQRGKESTSLIDAEMEALKRLGFNALWRADLTRLKKHGFSKAHAARFVWHVCKDWPPGCRFQPDFPRMVSYYEELRAQLGSDDLDPLTCVTVMDEPAS